MNNRQNPIAFMINETAYKPKAEDVSVISNENNRPTIQTVLQDVNNKNRNQRIYLGEDLFPELTCPRQKELISTGNMFGEAGHPTSKDIARQQTIDPNNISHRILKLWHEGDLIKAHVKAAATSVGDNFNRLILDGTLPSFSLRALGTIQNTSKGAVVKNIKVITWDWVVYPSHKCAYMEKIVTNESASMLNEGSELFVPEDFKGTIEPVTNKQIISYIQKESGNVTNILESFNKLYNSMELMNKGRQVRLMTESGEIFIVNLEKHIQDQIMGYCHRL